MRGEAARGVLRSGGRRGVGADGDVPPVQGTHQAREHVHVRSPSVPRGRGRGRKVGTRGRRGRGRRDGDENQNQNQNQNGGSKPARRSPTSSTGSSAPTRTTRWWCSRNVSETVAAIAARVEAAVAARLPTTEIASTTDRTGRQRIGRIEVSAVPRSSSPARLRVRARRRGGAFQSPSPGADFSSQSPSQSPRVMCLAFGSHASGLNLHRANHVVIVHPFAAKSVCPGAPDLTPLAQAAAYERQAVGRIAQGKTQRKTCHAYRMFAVGTVEEELSPSGGSSNKRRELATNTYDNHLGRLASVRFSQSPLSPPCDGSSASARLARSRPVEASLHADRALPTSRGKNKDKQDSHGHPGARGAFPTFSIDRLMSAISAFLAATCSRKVSTSRFASVVLLHLRAVVALHVLEDVDAELLQHALDLLLEVEDLGLELGALRGEAGGLGGVGGALGDGSPPVGHRARFGSWRGRGDGPRQRLFEIEPRGVCSVPTALVVSERRQSRKGGRGGRRAPARGTREERAGRVEGYRRTFYGSVGRGGRGRGRAIDVVARAL